MSIFNYKKLHLLQNVSTETMESIFLLLKNTAHKFRSWRADVRKDAHFWIAFASFYEDQKQFSKAIEVYEESMAFDAQPSEALSLAFRYFLMRINELEDGKHEQEQEIHTLLQTGCEIPEPMPLPGCPQESEPTSPEAANAARLLDRTITAMENVQDALEAYEMTALTPRKVLTKRAVNDTCTPQPHKKHTENTSPLHSPLLNSPVSHSAVLDRVKQERSCTASPLLSASKKRQMFLLGELGVRNASKSSKILKFVEENLVTAADTPSVVHTSKSIACKPSRIPKPPDASTVKYSLVRLSQKYRDLTETAFVLSPRKRSARIAAKHCSDDNIQGPNSNHIFDSPSKVPPSAKYTYVPNMALHTHKRPLKPTTILNRASAKTSKSDSLQNCNPPQQATEKQDDSQPDAA